MTTTERTVEFTEAATAAAYEMCLATERVRQAYGQVSMEYTDMAKSLIKSLSAVFSLGGRISQDGPLSLLGTSFMTYGVIFFPADRTVDRATLLTAPVPGTWSVHS